MDVAIAPPRGQAEVTKRGTLDPSPAESDGRNRPRSPPRFGTRSSDRFGTCEMDRIGTWPLLYTVICRAMTHFTWSKMIRVPRPGLPSGSLGHSQQASAAQACSPCPSWLVHLCLRRGQISQVPKSCCSRIQTSMEILQKNTKIVNIPWFSV